MSRLTEARTKQVKQALLNKNTAFPEDINLPDLVVLACRTFDLPEPDGKFPRKVWNEYLGTIANFIAREILSVPAGSKRKKKKWPKKRSVSQGMIDEFYLSYEWREVRYEVMSKNDGRCHLCGRSRKHGVVLHCDHIKPLRFNWDLRLDPNNLQVLCEICNHGKGNWDETDWRTA